MIHHRFLGPHASASLCSPKIDHRHGSTSSSHSDRNRDPQFHNYKPRSLREALGPSPRVEDHNWKENRPAQGRATAEAEKETAPSRSLASPAALVLHNALTTYHALTLALGNEWPERVVVHVIGAEREVEQLGAFAELSQLVPRSVAGVTLVFVGPGVPAPRDGEVVELAGGACAVTARLVHAPYERFIGGAPPPTLAVGLNAGLACAEYGWAPALIELAKRRIPAVFTDYMRESCFTGFMSFKRIFEMAGATALEARLNPFRQPLDFTAKMVYQGGRHHRFPAFSNGYVFGFVYPRQQ